VCHMHQLLRRTQGRSGRLTHQEAADVVQRRNEKGLDCGGRHIWFSPLS
jgi:hypothetical protein